MKVYVYPADLHGCGHYRLIWAARALQAKGYDVDIAMPNERAISAEIGPNNEIKNVFVPEDANVIVMQRTTHRFLADAIPAMRQSGITVVIDMDDDLSRIHPRNPGWVVLHPNASGKQNPDHNWHHAIRACDQASLVTLSTPALVARYARHGRFRVLYNAVPESYLKVEHIDGDHIGWAGSLASHPDDLKVMGSSIARLTQGRDFHIIGDPGGVKAELGLEREPTSPGIVQLEDWPTYVSQLGIGVAPLTDTQFNAAKSWLKPLEMAAVGVPCVMSPRVEYRRIHRKGVGLLAENQRQWYSQLKKLRDDRVLRTELAAQAREAVSDQTYELRCEEWWEAWEAAYQYDQTGVTPAKTRRS